MICRRAPSCEATDLPASIVNELQAAWLHRQVSIWASEQSTPEGGSQVAIAGSPSWQKVLSSLVVIRHELLPHCCVDLWAIAMKSCIRGL
jgi:hypothetical protein